jgi:hypothetical protein
MTSMKAFEEGKALFIFRTFLFHDPKLGQYWIKVK